MSHTRDVALIIPTWNSLAWIEACLEAVAAQTLQPTEMIIVDDGSTDGTARWLTDHAPQARVEQLVEQQGFAVAVNRGIRVSSSPLIALLNVDTIPAPDWLERLVAAISDDPRRPGSVASKMVQLSEPGLVDNAGDTFSRYGSARKRGHGEPENAWTTREPVLSACAGAALYRRELLEEVGRFDETYESYFEDVDLGLRARSQDYECLFEPAARVRHAGGGSELPRARYVRLITANRAATLLKNFPLRLLVRHGLRLVWGQWYFLVAYRRPISSLAGYWDLLRRVPGILRARRSCQMRRSVSVEDFDALLQGNLGEPPLRQLLRRKMASR